MRHSRLRPLGAALALLLAACGAGSTAGLPPTPTRPPQPPASTAAPTAAPAPAPTPPAGHAAEHATATFPDATTIGLTAAADGALYAVFGSGQSLFVARSDDGGASFGEPVLASGTTRAMINPFERPTVIAGPDGAVAVSWLEQQDTRTTIWLARSADRAASFAPPEEVAVSAEFETTMARLAAPPPALAVSWLQGGGLWFGRAGAEGASVAEVDGQVCECCQPAALSDGERLFLAYRNLERAGSVDTRDIVVAVSDDGGASFEGPTRVSDTPWQVNACPISGPALAAAGGRLFVAWMDGRADTARDGTRGDLWVAASDDGGASFGPNVRVNREAAGFHNLPALGATPDGRLHIAWEADEDGAASIQYTTSDDAGASFAAPQTLAAQDDERGRPRGPALAVSAAGVHIAWIDRAGGRVMTVGAHAR